MIFGAVPTEQAEGAVLVHTQRLRDRVIRKGHVLDRAAVADLGAAGIHSVVVARLEPGEVDENETARRMALCFASDDLICSAAATGRVNLVARRAGLLRIDAGMVDRVNLIDEALTIATLPDYAVVAARDMVATVKVIPFSVRSVTLSAAESAARDGAPAIVLHPFSALRVGLVLTELPGLKDSVLAGTVTATQARLTKLGSTLLSPVRCPHREDDIEAALHRLLSDGADLLLIAGASAVVDRRDVGPAAIVAAGGVIEHFGMPVDPGNLICIGRIGAVPALVLPGCARSPKLNGVDWVLARLAARLPVGPGQIMRMGVGGLLKDVPLRPLPRARAPAMGMNEEPSRPATAAVILAAGRSSRMAPHNKLLVKGDDGKPMIARVVDNVLSSGARPVLVVTGHMAEAVERALDGRPVRFIHAADYSAGLSASLKAGLAAVPADSLGALVCLGDMPLVNGPMLDMLLAAFDPDEGRSIIVPTYHGKAGNPILWDRAFFPEMMELMGDRGARTLLDRHLEQVAEIEIDDDAILRDFDTVESLANAYR